MGNEIQLERSQDASESSFIMGQTFGTHGYRILTSKLYPDKLHPLIDFIIYDPTQNDGKLMSEYIFENIFTSMMSHQQHL
jgi:hypothetical protein